MYWVNGLYPVTVNGVPTFQGANPGAGIPYGTEITADWLGDVQGELLNILAAANINPAQATPTQVLAALRVLFAGLNGSANEAFQVKGPTNPSGSSSALNSSNFASSLGQNGWKKYADPESPTGYFIEQWGVFAVQSSGSVYVTDVNLPIAYPNNHMWAIAVWGGNAPPGSGNVASNALSKSQIQIATNSPSGPANAISFLSKGY